MSTNKIKGTTPPQWFFSNTFQDSGRTGSMDYKVRGSRSLANTDAGLDMHEASFGKVSQEGKGALTDFWHGVLGKG